MATDKELLGEELAKQLAEQKRLEDIEIKAKAEQIKKEDENLQSCTHGLLYLLCPHSKGNPVVMCCNCVLQHVLRRAL